MDRQRIETGIREIGPCTTGELTRHLCGSSPNPTEATNIRTKLHRMHKQGRVTQDNGRWML